MPNQRPLTLSQTLAFHHIETRLTWGITNFSPSRFRSLVRYLAELRHEFELSPRVTFDDGYQSLALHAAPVLREFGFGVKVFVPTAFIGGWNTWDYSHALCPVRHMNEAEMRELAKGGVEFQSHGHAHRDLTKLPPTRLREDVRRSKEVLQEILGREVAEIAYPYGRYNPVVENVVREVGYTRAWSMCPTDKGPFTFGRWGVYSYDTPLAVGAKLGGTWLTSRVELYKSSVVALASRLGEIAFWTNRG